MISRLLLALRIAVVLFPTVSGVFLTSYGAGKLNEAYIVPSASRTNPYGFLIFSTMSLPKGSSEAHFWIQDISISERAAKVNMYFESLVDPPSYDEQVIGFQIPHFCDFLNLSIRSESEEFEVSEVETIHLEDEASKESTRGKANTTLIYARFSSAQPIERCSGDLLFSWKGLVTKESFSSYMISIPLADSQGDTHEKVLENCPNASVYYSDTKVKIMILLPENCKYKESIIPPTQELAQTTESKSTILWEILNPNIMGTPGTTYRFAMSFENKAESELRDHLLFDSGLYMGLGVSLIFGGLYEAVKISTDAVKEKRKA